MFDLSGKIAMVTGSARGLGFATAACLAKAGATVIINDLSPERCDEAVEKIKAAGGKAFAATADISNEQQIKDMFGEIDKKFGRLDILVNNAGINTNFNIFNMELAEWNKVIGINLTGCFLCTKNAIPLMQKNKWGRIISIASIAAEHGALYGQAHYSASKGGVISFTKTVARSVAKDGITVNGIAPGVHKTEMVADMHQYLDPQVKADMLKLIPIGKLGTMDDIGYAATFLASEEAGYITGTILDVNGGMYMK